MANAATRPVVSVALCTHNGSAYIVEQVTSILAQSVPAAEIVLSDDASSDDTVDLVRAAVDAHNASGASEVGLRIMRNTVALGVARNFEQAISATTGEFVALCDQDDVWQPQKLERALAALAVQPAVSLVFSDARMVDADGSALGLSLFQTLSMTRRERRLIRRGDAFAALLGRNLVTGATVVFRRALLPVAEPFPADWIHDEWLAAVAAATGRVLMLDEQLVDYRQHGANQIGAARLSASAKLRRVAEGRAARNARLLARASELVDRLERLGGEVSPGILAEARKKLEHESVRSALPAARGARLPAVVGEFLLGRYTRYGRGLMDAGRDLLQPAR